LTTIGGWQKEFGDKAENLKDKTQIKSLGMKDDDDFFENTLNDQIMDVSYTNFRVLMK